MKKSIFLFFAAILCAMTANAFDQSNVDLYFDNSTSKWEKCYVYIGKDDYTSCFDMTRVSGTQYLWKLAKGFDNGNKWNGAKGWVVCKEKWWSGNSENVYKFVYHGNYNVTNITTSAWSDSKIYKANGTQSVNHFSTNCTVYKVTSSTKSDYKVTINSAAGGTLTVKDYDDAAVNNGDKKIKLTVLKFNATAAAGYTIGGVEIKEGSTTTTISAANLSSKTHTLTSDVTITPIFVPEDTHEVTVSYLCNSNPIAGYDSKKEEVGVTTPSSFTAPKIKDYTFSGWTLGSGVQSVDETANPISITTKSSGDYTLTANYTYIEPVIKTIYCKMEHDWWYSDGAAISAYVWGDEEGEWKSAPGALMALAPWETKVWKIDIDIARYPKVCFIRVKGDGSANWGAQTKDLVIPTDEKNLFTISNTDATWASSSKCDGTWSVYTPAPIPDRYLTGNDAGFGMTGDGSWSPNTIKMTWNDATQKFTHTVSGLEANKYYKFRITDGTWAGKWGYSNLKSAIENVFEAEDNNISFVLAADGDLTITFDGTYIELTTSSSFAAPIYTIVGDELLMGTHWDLNSVENQMKHSAGNIYTLEKNVRIPAGEYEYKAVRNYSYDWEVPNNGGKNKVTIEKSGEGTIIYTLDIANYELKHEIKNWEEKDLSNTVELYGIGENKTFIEAVDRKTTSVDVVLEANKVYSFEVVVNSVYMKNTGVMWRGNCEGWTFTPEGSRAHIITDLPGTYTFTWTYDGNKLSVTYPEGTNVPAPVFLAGKMNNWERLATRLIPSADGTTASATIELERNVYNDFRMVIGTEDWTNTGKMKRDNCSDWTFDKVTEDNQDVNAGIIPDATGEYTFTWSYADNKLSVTYPTETCTDCSAWYLCGSFNDWKLSNEFTKTATADVVEATLTLEAGTYTFKVQDMTDPTDGKWYGNNATMERNNTGLATGWTFATDKDHCTIVADITGDYIFTWNTDTKKLTVQYPTPTITLTTGDNSTVINANIGNTVNVKIERSFTANDGYYTLCVPFEMPASVIGTVYEISDLEKYETGKDGGLYIKLSQVTTLSAGVPYLVEPKENMDELLVKNVIIAEDDESSYTRSNAELTVVFYGSYSAGGKTNGSTEYYVGDGGLLYNNSVDKRGLCGYFAITDNNGDPVRVRARVVAGENVETGVDNIVTTDAPVKVIVNGQLIIIRDGVKYNVQGQVIK